MRSLARTLLERKGYRVFEADSGMSALKSGSNTATRLIFCSPTWSCPRAFPAGELAARLLSEKPGLKVIYSSGYTDDMLGEGSPLRNNPNFLEKPFDAYKLLKRVRDCLDGVNGIEWTLSACLAGRLVHLICTNNTNP